MGSEVEPQQQMRNMVTLRSIVRDIDAGYAVAAIEYLVDDEWGEEGLCLMGDYDAPPESSNETSSSSYLSSS